MVAIVQDRYFGDLGDFGKYGLLRTLAGRYPQDDAFRLGIVWYLVKDETHNEDGKHVTYLHADRNGYRSCDPDLFDALKHAVPRRRSVALLPELDVLPSNTVYFDTPLDLGRGSAAERWQARASWVQRALAATAESQMVFLDPDNGIAFDSSKLVAAKGNKFAGLSEMADFHRRGQSVVVYHHTDRSASVPVQAERWTNRVREAGIGIQDIIALRYRRGTSRFFFILPAQQHASSLYQRTERFIRSKWGGHFEALDC